MKTNSDTVMNAPVKRRVPEGDCQIGVEERAAINEVMDAGRMSECKKVREFEEPFA